MKACEKRTNRTYHLNGFLGSPECVRRLPMEEDDEGLSGAGFASSHVAGAGAGQALPPGAPIPGSVLFLLQVTWQRRGIASKSQGHSVPICKAEMLIALSIGDPAWCRGARKPRIHFSSFMSLLSLLSLSGQSPVLDVGWEFAPSLVTLKTKLLSGCAPGARGMRYCSFRGKSHACSDWSSGPSSPDSFS